MQVTKQQLRDCLHCIARTKQQYDRPNLTQREAEVVEQFQETWDAISQIVYQSHPAKKYFEVN